MLWFRQVSSARQKTSLDIVTQKRSLTLRRRGRKKKPKQKENANDFVINWNIVVHCFQLRLLCCYYTLVHQGRFSPTRLLVQYKSNKTQPLPRRWAFLIITWWTSWVTAALIISPTQSLVPALAAPLLASRRHNACVQLFYFYVC